MYLYNFLINRTASVVPNSFHLFAVIQFGFLLSGTKEVVETRNSKEKLGKVVGKITQAKLILSIPAFLILVILILYCLDIDVILIKHSLINYLILSEWNYHGIQFK